MKKKITSLTFLLLLMIGAVMGQGVYQFPNSDFEMWRNGSGNNGPQRPRYWHSFSEATGGYQSLSSTDYHEKVTGHSGYALRIKAHKVWAIITVKANGAMSTGRTMMGSSTVSSPQNYNFDPNATDANGDSFQWTFHGKPDSISFWARANANYSSSTEAILKVYIHDENEFKDHADNSETGTWYGRCLMNFVPSSGWTRIARPVEWKSQYSGVTPSLILGSFSTCKNAGQGSGQEELDIDELRCIYDKGLATLSIGGVANSAIKDVFNANEYTTHSGLTGAGTNSGTYTYEYTSSICASDFTENFVQATAKSARVHSLTITQPTVANPNAVITVTHNDNSTFIYTIHFANVINSVVEISTPNTTVCSADGAVLTAATGFDSYSWSNGASGNSTTVYSTGTYTVTASKQGCTATSSIAITVNPSPAVIINGDAEFCAGSNFELTAAGASSYVWSTGSHNATSGNITAAGTYAVTGTGANGCTATATQTVAMKETPNVQINSSSANPCPGDEVTLTATGGVSYAWSTGAQTAAATVVPSSTTTYTVTATGANGCTKVESYELAVAAGAVPIQINGPNTVCVGDVVNNITATEGLSGYSWSGVSSEYFYSVNNTAGLAGAPAGTYVIELRATAAGSSCESYTTHTIQVVEPTVTLSSMSDLTICKGSAASLTASATTNCDEVAYAWTGNLTGNTVSVSPTATQTYTVTATVSLPADLHNCTATDTKSVTVNVNAPSVSLNTLNNVALCEGADLNLTASLNGSANGNVTYAWTVPAGNSSETNTYTLNNITTAATGNYTVMATATQSLNGVTCSATDSKSAQVTVNALPNVTISGSNVLCAGSTTRLTAEGGSSYLWNNGQTTAALQVATAGTYMVIGTDANGCSNTAETTVTVNNPSVVLNDMADQTICAGSEAELAATLNGAATGDVTYAWNGNMTGREVTVSPATTTTYTVTATATIGDCSATDTKEVTVNVIPQVTLAAQNATQTVQYGNAISIITFETNGALSVVGDLPEGLSFDGVNRRITGTPTFVGTQTFNVVATAENECFQEQTQISITVENNASITMDNANQSVCPGNDIINIQIHATNVNIVGVTGLPQGIQYADGIIAGSSQESGTYDYTVQANDAATGASMNATGQIIVKTPGVKTILESKCTNDLPHVWHGIEYTQSGTYDYTIPGVEAVNGCDSIERLVLTVNPSPTATIVVEGMTARIQNPQEDYTYEWSNGDDGYESTYDAPGEHSVLVDAGYCSADIYFTITSAAPAITADITAPSPICANGTLTLTAPATTDAVTTGWQLSESDAFENPIAYTNQTLNETYNGWYLRYVAANGQTAAYSNVVTITVNALPEVSITGNTAICAGATTTLTAGEGASYAWSNQATTQAITVNEGGRYSVTVTDNNGCSNAEYVSVTVNALPEVTISGASTICAGAETTLTANGAATYEWPGYLDTQTATLLIAQAGTYQVVGTDENGCQNTATLTVVENTPSVTLATMEDIVVCENGTVQLNANLSGSAVGTVTYQWTGPNGFTANGQEATLQSATVAQSGAYTVTASAVNTMNGVSCTSTDSKSVSVTVNALPIVAITGNTAFCAGATTTLTASEGASYAWSNQATTQAITVNEGGRYSVTVTDNNGCSNAAYVSVTVNALPEVTISGASTICAGAETTLTANGAATYEWPGYSDAQTATLLIAQAGTYQVVGTDENGCQNTATLTVVENTPSVTLATMEDIVVCENGTVQLNANLSGSAVGTVTYQWTGPNGFTANGQEATLQSATVAQSGAYTVTASAVNTMNGVSCTSTDSKSVNVTVNALPEVTISGNTSFCAGATTTLTASEGASYAWSNQATTQAITVNEGGRYSVTVTDNNGCSNAAYVSVTVNALPEVTISGASTICGGAETTLTANGAATYEWLGYLDAQTATLLIAQAGTYQVVGTDENGCQNTASITVVENIPSVTLATMEDIVVCENGTVQLNANLSGSAVGTVTYQWTGPNGFTANGQEATLQSATVAQSGAYTVTASAVNTMNGVSCTSTDSKSVNVTVNALPIVAITGNTAFCAGATTTLTASEGASYAWSNQATTQAITVNEGGRYAVTVTDNNGCSNAEYVSVEALALPATPVATTVDNSSCAAPNGSIEIISPTGDEYTYSLNGGLSQSSTFFTGLNAGNYTLTVRNANGCVASSTVIVSNEGNNVDAQASANTTCVGGTIQLTGLSNTEGVTYSWSGPRNYTSSTQNPTIANATSEHNGVYTLTVTETATNCTMTASVNVTVNTLPNVTISGANTICAGAETTLTANGASTYVWQNDEQAATLLITQAGTYQVTGTDAFGCENTATITVVENTPSVTLASIDNVEICESATLLLNATLNGSATGDVTYEWTGPNNFSVRSQNASILNTEVSRAGEYTVLATATKTLNGVTCTATDSKTVNVIVNSRPEVTISGVTTICPDAETLLRATGASTYQWSTGIFAGALRVSRPGTYTVTGTDAHGCTNSASVEVVVNTPNVTLNAIEGNSTLCEGADLNLTASVNGTPVGNVAYMWNTQNTEASISIDNVTPNHAGTYTVVATATNTLNGVTCEATDTKSIEVTVNALPENLVFDVTNNTSCAAPNGVVVVTAPAGSNYSYKISTASAAQTSPRFEGLNAGVYTIVATNTTTGCQREGEVEVITMGSNLHATASTMPVCQGETATLTGTSTVSGVTFAWSGPANFSSAAQNPTFANVTVANAGEYTLTVTETATQCTATATTTLVVNVPQAQSLREVACNAYTWNANGETYTTSGTYFYAHEDQHGCTQVDTLHLTIHNPVHVAYTEVACDSYEWNGTTYTQSGNYLYAHSDANGCEQVDTLHLTIHNTPVVTISGNTNIVEGNSTTLTATGADTYVWNTDESTAAITVTPETTTTYTVVGTSNNCTAEPVSVVVNVSECVIATKTIVAEACGSYTWYGVEYTESTTTATHTVAGVAADGCDSVYTLNLTIWTPDATEFSKTACGSYTWENDIYTESNDYVKTYTNIHGCDSVVTLHLTINNPVHVAITEVACDSYEWNGTVYTQSGNYLYAHSDANGCEQVDTLHLTIHNTPVVTISGNTNIVEGNSTTLTATGADTYVWNTDESTAAITVTPETTTTYTVVGTSNNCSSNPAEVTVTVSECEIATKTIVAEACGSYTWYGVEYTESTTTATHTVAGVAADGCDSVYTLHLTIWTPDATEFSKTACGSYTWENDIYTESNDYVKTYTNIHGCDSVVTLHLTINNPAHVAVTEVACGNYEWNGNNYTESGSYFFAHEDANGCVQVDTLYLTINNPVHTAVTEVACGNYEWNGTVYTQSGNYLFAHEDANGCEQVDTLHLTINNPVHVAVTEVACGSYEWNGTVYTQSGNYLFAHEDANGCEQVDTLHLTINNPVHTAVTEVACGNYEWNGNNYTESGSYLFAHEDANGCEQVDTLHLTINNPVHVAVTEVACGNYEWNGTIYTQSGNYLFAHEDANGCEQVDTLHLTINNPVHTTVTEVACGNYEWNGTVYTQSGNYFFAHEDANGCEQVDTLHLTINNPVHTAVTEVACGSYEWNGTVYTQSGNYLFAHEDANGCEQVDTLHLTINNPVHTAVTEVACGNYEWNGTVYTQSGNYLFAHEDANGCEQVDTLHLTILDAYNTEFTEVACGSYTWDFGAAAINRPSGSITYTESGDYTETFVTALGCDSVVTLHLTINNPVHEAETVTACSVYEWNGTDYDESGDYLFAHEDANGCTQVDTLHLTINQPASKTIYATICNGASYEADGFNAHTAGEHNLYLTAANGCDSIVTLILTVDNNCTFDCGDRMYDVDHNGYNTKAYNGLCWMTENLRSTHYADGSAIPVAMIYNGVNANNDTVANLSTYGRLYDWNSTVRGGDAVMTLADEPTAIQGVCPQGWRLPTKQEYEDLVNIYSQYALRSANYWIMNAGSNATGFDLRPAGLYNGFNARCENMGGEAYFYTSTVEGGQPVHLKAMCGCWELIFNNAVPANAFSVRCVK